MCFGNLSPIASRTFGLAYKITCSSEPAEVGHSLQVPDNDARLHACRYPFTITNDG